MHLGVSKIICQLFKSTNQKMLNYYYYLNTQDGLSPGEPGRVCNMYYKKRGTSEFDATTSASRGFACSLAAANKRNHLTMSSLST